MQKSSFYLGQAILQIYYVHLWENKVGIIRYYLIFI